MEKINKLKLIDDFIKILKELWVIKFIWSLYKWLLLLFVGCFIGYLILSGYGYIKHFLNLLGIDMFVFQSTTISDIQFIYRGLISLLNIGLSDLSLKVWNFFWVMLLATVVYIGIGCIAISSFRNSRKNLSGHESNVLQPNNSNLFIPDNVRAVKTMESFQRNKSLNKIYEELTQSILLIAFLLSVVYRFLVVFFLVPLLSSEIQAEKRVTEEAYNLFVDQKKYDLIVTDSHYNYVIYPEFAKTCRILIGENFYTQDFVYANSIQVQQNCFNFNNNLKKGLCERIQKNKAQSPFTINTPYFHELEHVYCNK
ncbi:hypothetical protein [Fastidiosibacter lacustris]|uniref:hypothetical protein n=1 Tax=Fastidiosibacter lacustris TaxID=2056695 RepID=UPI000E353A10|nr:hypothetical protein [Fastidiosibacter lacustris]